MKYDTLELRLSGGVAVMELRPPDQRNPMTEQMAAEFPSALRQAAELSDAQALVITGAGQAFSAGGAFALMENNMTRGHELCRRTMLDYYGNFLALREFPGPVVAAVNGAAVGAGAGLALACDLRIASASAWFAFPFVKLGLSPGLGITHLLPRLVGMSLALDLLLTGRRLDAEEALRSGLVNQLAGEDALLAAAVDLARTVAAASRTAVLDTRRLLGQSLSLGLSEALEREAECQARQFGGRDIGEGLAAAKEKRPPRFGEPRPSGVISRE